MAPAEALPRPSRRRGPDRVAASTFRDNTQLVTDEELPDAAPEAPGDSAPPTSPEVDDAPHEDDDPATFREFVIYCCVLGVVVCGVLEWVHVTAYLRPGASSFCKVSPGFDCATVATSRFAAVLGVPMPLWGTVGFIAMAVAASKRWAALVWLTGVASAASLLLIAEEILYIKSMCLLCEGVHLMCFAAFGLAWKAKTAGELDLTLSREQLATAVGFVALPLLFCAMFLPRYLVLTGWDGSLALDHGTTADGDEWIGATEAKVTVHEHVDYKCGHCATGAALTRVRVMKHQDELRLVRHHAPMSSCRKVGSPVCQYVRAAQCAKAQDKYWQMDDWLLRNVFKLKGSVDLKVAARVLNMDGDALLQCMAKPESYGHAEALAAKHRAKISKTPTYELDGKIFQPNEIGRELDRLLE